MEKMIRAHTFYPNFRYLNALEAGVTYFSEQIKEREIIRTAELLKSILTDPSRKSNGKERWGNLLAIGMCIPRNTCVFLCIPMYSYVFLCITIFWDLSW